VSHLFVLAMVVTMVNLGFWQLSRLDEKMDRNERVAARMDAPAADGAELLEPGDVEGVADAEFARVTASGTYRADEEVLVRGRSLNGAAGSWVLTPLEVGDGLAVAVNRGWIPNSGELTAVPEDFAAPDGEVTVTGLVRRSETKGAFGADDPDGERLTELARADVARLDQQVEGDLVPYVLQLQQQDPPVGDGDPTPVPAPALDEGPHLSYAVQWFTFSTMTVIVYALILRKKARQVDV
jgi:surfeit locus 1 family protein